MKIEGLYMKYHGKDWKTSPSDSWHIDYIDEFPKATAKKVGTRLIHGIKANVYACDQCPNTFYAD